MLKRLGRLGALAAAMLAAAPGALAQGCAMCYADAAAQSPRAKHMLDLAILTLLIPSVCMFAGVLIAAFRRRERDTAEAVDSMDAAPVPNLAIPAEPRGLASDHI